MKPEDVLQYCLDKLEGVSLVSSWGERGIFYNPEGKLKRGIYVLTVKEKDGKNDSSSNLNREGVYRVNLGVRKDTFREMFDLVPERPCKGGIVNMNYDFTMINQMLPHPVYAWMGWICILNPSAESFEMLKRYIHESYTYAKEKYSKKKI